MKPRNSNLKMTAVDQTVGADLYVDEREDQFARERLISRLRLLWQQRRVWVRCTAVGLVAATLIAFLLPNQYESTARLMPPDSRSTNSLAMLAGLTGSGGLGMLAGDLLGIKSSGALFEGVLRSRTVEDRIVDQFDLKKVYGMSLQVQARQKLEEHTAITQNQKSGIITITVTDNDPRRAAAMTREYVNELNWVVTHLSTSSAHRERVFLDQRLKQVSANLEEAEKKFSDFASKKGAIDVPAQGKAMVTAAATLQGQLIAAESELQALKQIYTNNNVRVRSTQAQVNELRNSLQKIAGKGADENSSAKELFPSISQLPVLGVTYADLLRHTKVQEAIFETLTQQDELAKVQEAKEVPSVKELDAPVVPEQKSFPPRMLLSVLGTFCGAMMGMAWVLGKARWQEIDTQDPGKVLAQEVFNTFAARIPRVSRNGAGEKELEAEAKEQEEKRADVKSAGLRN